MRGLGLLLATAVVACAGADEPVAEAPASPPPDGRTVEASIATKNELGIVRWQVPAATDAAIEGVDSAGHVIAALAHRRSFDEDGRARHEFVLRRKEGDGHLTTRTRFAGEEVTSVEAESSFLDIHDHTAHRLAEDLRAAKAEPPSDARPIATRSTPGGLAPQELTDYCVDALTNDCPQAQADYDAAVASVAETCRSADAAEALCEDHKPWWKNPIAAVEQQECIAAYRGACEEAQKTIAAGTCDQPGTYWGNKSDYCERQRDE